MVEIISTSTRVQVIMINSRLFAQIEQTLRCVPSGSVASYGQIADLAGLPGRARLVGLCLKQASADKHLPWHRIIRANGSLAFPSSSEQAQRQRALLQDEGVLVVNNRVPIKTYGWQPDLADLLFQLKF